MLNNVIYKDGEEIIGYSDDIIESLKENGEEDDEITSELIEMLQDYDYDLVICRWHPMGAWYVAKLVEEEK